MKILKETFVEWQADHAPRLGAALAYYSLFSVGPMLLLATAIAGAVFGEEAVSGELHAQLRSLLGENGATAVEGLLASTRRPEAFNIAGATAIITLIIGATGVIVELKESLNAVWEVEPKPGRSVHVFLKKYIVSLAAVIGIGFLLMISLVLSASVAAAGRFFETWLPLPEAVFHLADFVSVFTLLTLLLGAMFKYLPDVRLSFRAVLPGAALTALLFMVGKLLIGLYLGKVGVGSTFGAAGSIVVVMVWVYYTAQIIFFGAEFTEVYSRSRGLVAVPEPDAVPLPGARKAPSLQDASAPV